jgi:hypothetical protein
MKNNIALTLLLLIPGYLYSSDEIPTYVEDTYGIMKDGKREYPYNRGKIRITYEDGTDGGERDANVPTQFEFLTNDAHLFQIKVDLPYFQMHEQALKEKGINLLTDVRIRGLSYLQYTLYHYCTADMNYQQRMWPIVEYILSNVTARELNEFIVGSWIDCDSCYYGTAVAIAALHYPRLLTKILNHKFFDATTFLTAQPLRVNGRITYSLTPQCCIEILEIKKYTNPDAQELITILKEKFNL